MVTNRPAGAASTPPRTHPGGLTPAAATLWAASEPKSSLKEAHRQQDAFKDLSLFGLAPRVNLRFLASQMVPLRPKPNHSKAHSAAWTLPPSTLRIGPNFHSRGMLAAISPSRPGRCRYLAAVSWPQPACRRPTLLSRFLSSLARRCSSLLPSPRRLPFLEHCVYQ